MSLDIANLKEAELEQARANLEISIGGKPVGSISLKFWPQAAPQTVRNFLAYAAEGFYDGKGFHRIIEGFMIQGGCPLGNGTGGGPKGNIPGEFSTDPRFSHKRGVLSMARAQHPDSASCQFFICHRDADFLDGQYAAFGEVVDGLDILDAAATTPTDGQDRPKSDVGITRMTVSLAEA
ncbi:MAG: peptidylprolyl isomerase [Planctomycetota bacterium]|nr:MAG: peptidylprolyl isomerase [Planctomycetota bacterium]